MTEWQFYAISAHVCAWHLPCGTWRCCKWVLPARQLLNEKLSMHMRGDCVCKGTGGDTTVCGGGSSSLRFPPLQLCIGASWQRIHLSRWASKSSVLVAVVAPKMPSGDGWGPEWGFALGSPATWLLALNRGLPQWTTVAWFDIWHAWNSP